MKNWKTTLAGVGMGAANLFLASMAQGIKPKDAALSIGLALLGAYAKDHDVTGGTKQQ
jgi:hypothetical protein